jgi:hypothetical protein
MDRVLSDPVFDLVRPAQADDAHVAATETVRRTRIGGMGYMCSVS